MSGNHDLFTLFALTPFLVPPSFPCVVSYKAQPATAYTSIEVVPFFDEIIVALMPDEHVFATAATTWSANIVEPATIMSEIRLKLQAGRQVSLGKGSALVTFLIHENSIYIF